MLTSIREELSKRGISLQNSVYKDVPNEILDYKIIVGDFIEEVIADKVEKDFNELHNYYGIQQEIYSQDKEYSKVVNYLREIKRLIKSRNLEPDEKINAHKKRRELSQKIKALTDKLEIEVEEKLGFSWKNKKVLCYKNTVSISWLEDLIKRLGMFEHSNLLNVDKYPLFISNLPPLEEALKFGKPIGIEGGPCLFGKDEVIFEITLKDGKIYHFDSCCGRRCFNENKIQITLEEFTQKFGSQIMNVELNNRKNGLTKQEYDSIYNLFLFASIFNAKCVLPLPDFSYFKYVESDLSGLTPELKEKSMNIFKKECFVIVDMVMELIKKIAKQFPSVEYCVLHYRNEKLLNLFYEKRKIYVENSPYIQKITNISGKKDSIIDYIMLVALPYYIYGTKTLIQVDGVDETDSGRKCNKIHKGDISVTQILYPEFLSPDNKNTFYHAPYEYKNYLNINSNENVICKSNVMDDY